MIGDKKAKCIAKDITEAKDLIVKIAVELKTASKLTLWNLKRILPKEDYKFLTQSEIIAKLIQEDKIC